MITNIERVFLTPEDVDRIHPYFASHRPAGSFLKHLAIQRGYALVVAGLVFAYFLARAVFPTLNLSAPFRLSKILVCVAFVAVIIRDQMLLRNYDQKYQEYLDISPGIPVNREVDFGTTHGKR